MKVNFMAFFVLGLSSVFLGNAEPGDAGAHLLQGVQDIRQIQLDTFPVAGIFGSQRDQCG